MKRNLSLAGRKCKAIAALILICASLLSLNQTAKAADIAVCGVVSSYTAAGTLTTGAITIGGVPYTILAGVTLQGTALITTNANLCLNATTNVAGIITAGTLTLNNVTTTVSVCGKVSAISASSLTINGTTYPIAAGVIIEGASQVAAGMEACLKATLNASGQIIAPSSLIVQASTTVNVCGVVSALSTSSITINGTTYPIASGITIEGINAVAVGANACLNATLNAAGQIILPSSITVTATAEVNLCGKIEAYQAATATAQGVITLGGTTIPIAAGTQIAGAENISVGLNMCLNARLNAAGQIIPPCSIAVNINTTTTVCGKVTAYTAATANSSGTITVGGVTLTIAPGVVLSGVTIGAEICLTLTGNTSSVGSGAVVTPVDGSCNQLKFTTPLATHGFLRSPFLPDGDLFLLQQGLNFSVTSAPDGVEVFDVNTATFGGTPIEIGNFTGVATGLALQGLAVSATGRTSRTLSCTDSVQKIDFVLAGSSNSGSTVRLFMQNSDGSKVQEAALFTAEVGGWRVTSLSANVVLFANNRFLSGAGQISAGMLITANLPAGNAGVRTGLLTLAFSNAANSPFKGCHQLGMDVANANGKTSVVITDAVVNRTEVTGDRARIALGMLAGVGGGYPTGLLCATVCPPCNASQSTDLATVSGANYDRNSVTTQGIASVFGKELAVTVQGATSWPLPTVLAGTSVKVKDNLGIERFAPLFYVSPTQINFLVPDGTAIGDAAVTITNGKGQIITGSVKVKATAPGLFSADASGQGIAAGAIVRVKADGSQRREPVAIYDQGQGKMVGVEIDLGDSSEQVFLELYGTGIRFRSHPAAVQARVGNVSAEVSYAGAQGHFAGLDQVNIRLSPNLRGTGKAGVWLTVDGKVSNQVEILIK